MFTTNLSPDQRLQKAVVDIMANEKYIALAGVLMIGTKQVDDSTPTAYTNGRDEVYGRAFIEKLTDPELRFVVLHECYHKLYRHLITWKHLWEVNANRTNQACDYVINGKIVEDNPDGFAIMPDIGLHDSKYDGMDAAQVYHLLKDGEGSGEDSGEDSGEGGEGGMDSHGWEDAQDMSAEEAHALEREIDEAVRQGALMAGKVGSGGARDLEGLLQPQVDWREVLREFINTTCSGHDFSTWARPNRRYMTTGIYMPSGISEQVGELVLAIDTSGSIGGRELSAFLSEVKGIADTVKPEKVRVLYWDTEVCRDESYTVTELDTLPSSTKPAGGGGTAVTCVPEYMREHSINPQAVIVLTDGYLGGGWGTWSNPLLWCLLDNEHTTPDTGKLVRINTNSI